MYNILAEMLPVYGPCTGQFLSVQNAVHLQHVSGSAVGLMLFDELHFEIPAGTDVCKSCKCHVCCKQWYLKTMHKPIAYMNMFNMQLQHAW